MDSVLFAAAVLLLALAVMRAFCILLDWYLAQPRAEGEPRPGRGVRAPVQQAGQPLHRAGGRHHLLQHLGVNVASLVVSLGVGSLAVGLAAQDTLANMFAGFTLMLDRPFRVGDRIQLASGELGDVEAIGMRATLIRTTDETLLVVPNSVLVKERLVNLSSRPDRSPPRPKSAVGFGTDLALVKALLAEAALVEHAGRRRSHAGGPGHSASATSRST